MPDGGWEPVDPWPKGTTPGRDPSGDADGAETDAAGAGAGAAGAISTGGRLARSPRWSRWVAAGAAAAVGIVAWTVVGQDDGAGDGAAGEDALSEVRERTDAERAADGAATTATEDARTDAQRAFARASRRLELAGSYTYQGTVHAPTPSDARPAQAPATDVTVDGEVLWPLRTHDVAVDDRGRAAETVTVGPSIWQRSAATEDGLAAASYALAGDVATWERSVVPFGAGAARLPGWLRATTDRRSGGYGSSGMSIYTAQLPADRLGTVGEGQPALAGQVQLTVDGDGAPVRVVVEVFRNEHGASSRPVWRLALTLSGLGDPVTIDLPNGELPAVTEGPAPAEVRAAGIAAPVELGRVPDDWMLAHIGLFNMGPGCESLRFDYHDIDAVASGYLMLQVLPPACAPPPGSLPILRSGDFTGAPRMSAGGAGGVLSDGRTTIEYISDLPREDALRLLGTLEPYDPSTRPTAMGPLAAP